MTDVKRVFIGEDDEAVLLSLKRLLVLSGFEVGVSLNPTEALPIIKVFKPHLILLDLMMPHLSGLEICQLLNDDPATSGTPIIIISALEAEEDIKKAYHLGVIGYFTKPYDFKKLLAAINKAIASKEVEP
jgi:DNA-binding response OmpR family regulator